MQHNLEEKYKLVKETIQKYSDQLKQSWEEVRGIHLPKEYCEVQNIVFCGMGGSALGARVVDAFAYDQLEVPLEIFNDYHLPAYVNDKSLVVVCSYSGNTEETLSDLHDKALERNAKIFGISTDGDLTNELERRHIPAYIFDPKYNPSKQPRMAIGYMCGAALGLLAGLRLIRLKDGEIYAAVKAMQEAGLYYGNETHAENTAFNLAQKLNNKMPVLVASEHLCGSAYTIKNQFNESAKTFCTLFELPELNHHLMEGLAHPAANKDLLHFVFFNSHLYDSRVQKRYPLTQEVVTKNGIAHSMFSPTGNDKLSQVFETLVFGSFCVYYLTKSYKIDPVAIPWVDYFKEQLA